MIDHARAYVDHARPVGRAQPLSCEGRRWDQRTRDTLDTPSAGGFMTTAVDSLDTLALVGDYDEFRRTVREVVRHLDFDRDVTVSVFETNIRVLGGLLSAHMLLEDDQRALAARKPRLQQCGRAASALSRHHARHLTGNCAAGGIDNRRNDEEGGHRGSRHWGSTREKSRAAPATSSFGSYSNPILGGFDAEPLCITASSSTWRSTWATASCQLFGRGRASLTTACELKYGVPKGETKETCLAAAGTLILEFGVLSRPLA